MAMPSDASGFDRSKAEMFEALGHPLRIKLLEAMKDGPVSFSELKKRTGIESSGHLTFHLDKLDGLVEVTQAGNYGLTDLGKEALALTSRIAPTPSGPRKNRIGIDRRTLGVLLVALFVLAVLAAPTVSGIINQAQVRHEIAAYFDLNVQIDQTTGAWTNESVWYDLQNYNALKSLNHLTIGSNGTILFDQGMLLGTGWKEMAASARPLTNYSFEKNMEYNVTMVLAFTDGSHYTISHMLSFAPLSDNDLGFELGTGFFFDTP